MATYENINLDDNIDLNELFHLNYNFDNLKAIVNALILAHRNTNSKIKDLEELNNTRDNRINE